MVLVLLLVLPSLVCVLAWDCFHCSVYLARNSGQAGGGPAHLADSHVHLLLDVDHCLHPGHEVGT